MRPVSYPDFVNNRRLLFPVTDETSNCEHIPPSHDEFFPGFTLSIVTNEETGHVTESVYRAQISERADPHSKPARREATRPIFTHPKKNHRSRSSATEKGLDIDR